MTKRYSMKGSTIFEDGEEITYWDCCDLLNGLNDENEQLKRQMEMKLISYTELEDENEQFKAILSNIFDVVLNLDFAKEQYTKALFRILGEENDVEKTKKRIKEFING